MSLPTTNIILHLKTLRQTACIVHPFEKNEYHSTTTSSIGGL